MSLSLSQIRNKARKHTNTTSASNGGYSDNDLNALINEVVQEVAIVTHSRTASTIDASEDFDTVAGTRLYSFPSKLLGVFEVYYDGERITRARVQDLEAEPNARGYWTLQGRPYYWYEEEGQIGLYPVPNDAKTVKCFGVRKPDVLTDDNDTPDIHESLHPAIEWGVAREMWLDKEDPENMAEKCGQRYNDKVQIYLTLNGSEDQSKMAALSPNMGI